MPYAHRSVIFTFFVFNLIFADLYASQNTHKTTSTMPESLHFNSDSSSQQSTQLNKKTHNFTEAEIEEMKLVMRNAPLHARLIIEHLKDPQFFPNNKDYRSALFVGEPGSGKTTMAKAIAYHMALHGWEYKILPSTLFLGEYRNQTAIKLQKELYAIETSNRPTVLIIDELNRLLENADSKHHDTDATSTALWTFLDRQAGNDQFFFIGTMNRIHKLPKPLKDRFLLNSIDFSLITDPSVKKEILRTYLTTETTLLDYTVTDSFLHDIVEKMGPSAGRNLKEISSMICRINKVNNPQNASVIKKESIEKAVEDYLQRKKTIQYDLVEETEEERQERHHKENIQMQKEHFVQQQILQAVINNNQVTITEKEYDVRYQIGSKISTSGLKEFQESISDEQWDLYHKMMLKTTQRREREAARKAKAEAIRKAKEEEDSKKWFWEK